MMKKNKLAGMLVLGLALTSLAVAANRLKGLRKTSIPTGEDWIESLQSMMQLECNKRYEGKFDVQADKYGNKIKFDINGKRVLIYNATVIVAEK
jgi:hypothetical protein